MKKIFLTVLFLSLSLSVANKANAWIDYCKLAEQTAPGVTSTADIIIMKQKLVSGEMSKKGMVYVDGRVKMIANAEDGDLLNESAFKEDFQTLNQDTKAISIIKNFLQGKWESFLEKVISAEVYVLNPTANRQGASWAMIVTFKLAGNKTRKFGQLGWFVSECEKQ